MQLTVIWRLILVRALLSSLATSSMQRLESVRCSLTEVVVETITTIRLCRNALNNATLTVGWLIIVECKRWFNESIICYGAIHTYFHFQTVHHIALWSIAQPGLPEQHFVPCEFIYMHTIVQYIRLTFKLLSNLSGENLRVSCVMQSAVWPTVIPVTMTMSIAPW